MFLVSCRCDSTSSKNWEEKSEDELLSSTDTHPHTHCNKQISDLKTNWTDLMLAQKQHLCLSKIVCIEVFLLSQNVWGPMIETKSWWHWRFSCTLDTEVEFYKISVCPMKVCIDLSQLINQLISPHRVFWVYMWSDHTSQTICRAQGILSLDSDNNKSSPKKL